MARGSWSWHGLSQRNRLLSKGHLWQDTHENCLAGAWNEMILDTACEDFREAQGIRPKRSLLWPLVEAPEPLRVPAKPEHSCSCPDSPVSCSSPLKSSPPTPPEVCSLLDKWCCLSVPYFHESSKRTILPYHIISLGVAEVRT